MDPDSGDSRSARTSSTGRTGGHGWNTLLVLTLAAKLEFDHRSLIALHFGMNVYDLGLMRAPCAICVKREELTAKGREKLRKHPNVGCNLVSRM